MMTRRSSAASTRRSTGATEAASMAPLVSPPEIGAPRRRSEVISMFAAAGKNHAVRQYGALGMPVKPGQERSGGARGDAAERRGLIFANDHGYVPRHDSHQTDPADRRRAVARRGDPPRPRGAGRAGHHQDRR